MKSVLLVSRDISKKKDGGTLVSKRNERLLKKLGYDVNRFVIPQPSMAIRIHNFIFKESYGETRALRKNFINELKKDYDFIFFDSSTYGGFVKLAHSFGKKIICFYHNVEYEYYSQKYNTTKKLLDKLIIPYIKLNELLSTKYCNAIITLTKRDSDGIKSLYDRSCDLIIPTSFEPRDLETLYSNVPCNGEPYILFVGTNFFANVEGLSYFIQSIAPSLNINIKIAGNISEGFKDKHNIPQNIKFLGQVNSLDELYLNASAVISPILSGSGLKTKTAEAFSYGKTVIGTEEAFAGINIMDYPEAAYLIKNDEDFINTINNLNKNAIFNKYALQLFNDNLSDDIYLSKLQDLIDSL